MMAWRFPVRTVTGGGGPAGEKNQGTEPHLYMVLEREEMARGGLPAVRGGRRWVFSGTAVLWWGRG